MLENFSTIEKANLILLFLLITTVPEAKNIYKRHKSGELNFKDIDIRKISLICYLFLYSCFFYISWYLGLFNNADYRFFALVTMSCLAVGISATMDLIKGNIVDTQISKSNQQFVFWAYIIGLYVLTFIGMKESIVRFFF